MKCGEFESAQDDRGDAKEHTNHQPESNRVGGLVPDRQSGGVPERRHADDEKQEIYGGDAKIRQECSCRGPRVEIAANVEITANEKRERSALDENHEEIAPPDRRVMTERVI